MSELAHLVSTLARLRGDFDGGFALPIDRDTTRLHEYVLIKIAAERYAISLTNIGGLFAGRAVTRVPTSQPEYLGLVGMRGSLFSVFDLAAMLGHAPTTNPYWMIACAGRRDVALTFETLDELASVAATDVVAGAQGEAVRANGLLHTVIRLGPLVESLRARMLSSSPAAGEAR